MSGTNPAHDWPTTWPHGWTVEWVAETGSTNADLLASAALGAGDRSVLAAGHQTAGRGRLDRRWEAPPGANLLVSLLFADVPTFTHQLTQRVALAAVAACRSITGREAVLKWPNDVLLDGAKLAGVLAQTGLVGARRTCVVVGIGVNIGWAPPDAICLGDAVDVGRFLATMLSEYDALPTDITPLYRERLATIGQVVRVELPGDRFIVGRAVDVEPDGRLVVLDDCAITHRIDTGDVVHLRPSVATDKQPQQNSTRSRTAKLGEGKRLSADQFAPPNRREERCESGAGIAVPTPDDRWRLPSGFCTLHHPPWSQPLSRRLVRPILRVGTGASRCRRPDRDVGRVASAHCSPQWVLLQHSGPREYSWQRGSRKIALRALLDCRACSALPARP